MLKRLLIMAMFGFFPSFAMARDISSASEKALETISIAYQKEKRPVMKKNVAVSEVRSPSPKFTAGGHQQTVRELLISRLSQSLVFNVIERERLDKILKEHALQQSGATNTKDNARIGELLNAHAILYGSLTELGDEGVLTLQLVDIETGKVYAAEERFGRNSLIAETERLADMAYLQKYGIGLSIFLLNTTFGGDNLGWGRDKTWLMRMLGFEAKYRFSEYFAAGLGLNMAMASYKRYDNYPYVKQFQNPLATVYNDGTLYIESGGAPGFTLALNLYLVYPFTRRFNMFLMLGAEPMLLTNVETNMDPGGGIPINQPVDERYRSYEERYKAESIAFNFGLGVEYYVLPRLALSLRGYFSQNKMRINTQPENIYVDMSGISVAPAVSLYF